MFYQKLKHLLLISLNENTLREEKTAKEKKSEIKECKWMTKNFMNAELKNASQLIVFWNAEFREMQK